VYPVELFHVHDRAEIRSFVEKYPFATLVATDAGGGFVATHVPLLVHAWDEQIIFRCHVMRDTDHWMALKHSPNVFVTFLGPDAPVRASWQGTKRFGGTWNFQALHVWGTAQGRDRDTLLAHLTELKDRFETNPDYTFTSLPQDYIDGLVPMIECIDIVVTDMRCLFKLSQNRSLEEFDRTVEGLRREGGKSALVADEMELRRAEFYDLAPGRK
jgi:transcriptional regulator